MRPIRLAAGVAAAIREESMAAYPREACGLLLGRSSAACDHAIRAAKCRNLASDLKRFELHPEDFLAAELWAEREDLKVLGVWHSHPDEPATPSDADRIAAHSGWCYLIAATGREAVHTIRGWELRATKLIERPLSIDPRRS